MKRRVRIGSKTTAGPGRKAAKSGSAPSTTRRHRPPLQEQLDEARRELRDARDEQTATSEVLKVISSSSGNLASVFESMLAHAVRICGAKFGNLHLYKDGKLLTVAQH